MGVSSWVTFGKETRPEFGYHADKDSVNGRATRFLLGYNTPTQGYLVVRSSRALGCPLDLDGCQRGRTRKECGMRIRMAGAMVLAAVAIVSCGKGGGGGGGAGGDADAGPHGPTDIVVSWTLAGMPADATTCMAQGSSQIYLNLSGTIDPSLHQSTTVPCSMGSVTWSQLLVENLGQPYLEGTLLDASGTMVAIVGVDVVPTVGMTNVTLPFFGPNDGGTGGMTTTSSSSSSSSTTSTGTGGDAGTSSSSSGGDAGTGGASSSSSSSSSSSTTSSGIADAGSD
jgi:hypothetical protein